jgi:hypothetical protein
MGAISSLILKSNSLCTKEAGKSLSQMLAANSTLKELDLSDNQSPPGDISARDGPGFAQELAVGIKDNGALLVLSLKSNNLRAGGGKALADGLKGNNVITELNIADNSLGINNSGWSDMSGIIALANAIPDMRALTKLDISNNSIEQDGALQQVIEYCNTKGIELDNHESESGGGY